MPAAAGRITEKLGSHGAAKQDLMPGDEHRRHKGLNSRVEKLAKTDVTTRAANEVLHVASVGTRFRSAHDWVNNLFHLRHGQVTASHCRAVRARAFETWIEMSGVAAAD